MQVSRLRQINPTVIAIVLFIIGIILIITVIASDPTHVTCNGQIMNSGDICVHSSSGVQTRYTLDQQRQNQQNNRILEILGALLCLTIAIFLFILRINKARAASKKARLDTASQPDDPQQSEADASSQGTNTQQSAAIPSLPGRAFKQTGTYPSLLTGTHPSLPSRSPQQTGTYPSLLTGTYPSLPSRAPQQTGTYPSLLTGTHLSLPNRAPQQTGVHSSSHSDNIAQSKAHHPAQGNNPQMGTTAQYRAYNLTPNDQSQPDTNPPPFQE